MDAAMIVEVGMAEMKISESSRVLVTRGLGSCLGIALYDPRRKVGALAHAMLPCYASAKIQSNPAKFVDSVIPLMIEGLKLKGATLPALKAKLFGAAHMFSSIPVNSPFNIGIKNINAAHALLETNGIEIIAEDTGGNYGRTIFFDLDTGMVRVKTIFFGEKEL